MKPRYLLLLLGGLLITLGLLFFFAQNASQEARYQKSFEKSYRIQQQQDEKQHEKPSQETPFYGAKESDIKKYKGSRYSTY